MKTVWIGIGLTGAALLSAQIALFGPVDIWTRNAADFIVPGAFLGAVTLLAFLAGFVPLAAIAVLSPARWRPVVAAVLAAAAILAWIYSSLLFRDSLAIDGRDELLNLASPLGPAELPLLALAVLALAFVVWRIPRPSLIFLLMLLAGNAVLTITRLITVRASEPELRMESADPLWRFSRQGNVLAILLDGLQSDVAAEELKKDAALAAELEGFILFKNTTGVAPTTFPTMPTIHSGALWEPDRSLVEQYEERVRRGSFLAGLARSGYETSMIGVIRSVCPQGTALCSGPVIAVGTPDGCPQASRLCRIASRTLDPSAAGYLPQVATLFDMSILRVAPYALKSVVYNSGGWRLAGAMAPAYSIEDTARSREMLEVLAQKLVVDDGPRTAKLLHVSATHQPYIFDAECRRQLPTIAGGMENAARCSLRSVAAILKRLKTLGGYDATTVLVFADHGAGRASRYRTEGRRVPDSWSVMAAWANPVLLVKPPGARGGLNDSMAEASVADIAATVCGLTKDCTALGGRSLFEAPQQSTTRSGRPFYHYQWRNEYWSLKSVPGVTTFTITGPPWEPASWRAAGKAALYQFGTPIDFRINGNLDTYAGYGWAHQESWGTWSDGATATLRLSPVSSEKADLVLTVQAQALVVPQQPRQDVDVLVNGRQAGTWTFDNAHIVKRDLRLPAAVIGDFETIEIAFVAKDARSPAELGTSSDSRRLGIGIAEAQLQTAQGPTGATASGAKAAAYRLGDTLDFRTKGNVAPYLVGGWAQSEAWGTWTDGEVAVLRLSPTPRGKGDLILTIRAAGLIAPQNSSPGRRGPCQRATRGKLDVRQRRHDGTPVAPFRRPAG